MINTIRRRQLYNWFDHAREKIYDRKCSQKTKARHIAALKDCYHRRVKYESSEALRREFYCMLQCTGFDAIKQGTLTIGMRNRKFEVRADVTYEGIIVQVRSGRSRSYRKPFLVDDSTIYHGLSMIR